MKSKFTKKKFIGGTNENNTKKVWDTIDPNLYKCIQENTKADSDIIDIAISRAGENNNQPTCQEAIDFIKKGANNFTWSNNSAGSLWPQKGNFKPAVIEQQNLPQTPQMGGKKYKTKKFKREKISIKNKKKEKKGKKQKKSKKQRKIKRK
jgi:hypothetical protein